MGGGGGSFSACFIIIFYSSPFTFCEDRFAFSAIFPPTVCARSLDVLSKLKCNTYTLENDIIIHSEGRKA